MKNLILLFTLIFVFGFSQTIEAQPVPGEVTNESQYKKPSKSKKGKTTKSTTNSKKECKKGENCKGQKGKKAKAVKAKHNPKHEEHRYHKVTGKHGHGKAKATNKGKATCERKAQQRERPKKGKRANN